MLGLCLTVYGAAYVVSGMPWLSNLVMTSVSFTYNAYGRWVFWCKL